jgi:hypothetical protein
MLKKYVVLIVVLSTSLMLLAGCGSKKENTNDNSVTATVTPSANVTTTEETDNPSDATNEEADDKSKETTNSTENEATSTPEVEDQKELPIYTINNDTLEKEDYTDMIPKNQEVTAEFIVSEVVKVFEENGLTVGINSVTTKNDTIYVDFQSDKAPLVNVGSGVEATILDCIAQSLVDNLEGHNKVVYHVDGKAYESGHIVLELNDVYLND